MILGKLKFYFARFMSYISMVQFVMVGYLFVKETKMSLWWLVACLPISALVIWVDYKWIVEGEVSEFFRRNKEEK